MRQPFSVRDRLFSGVHLHIHRDEPVYHNVQPAAHCLRNIRRNGPAARVHAPRGDLSYGNIRVSLKTDILLEFDAQASSPGARPGCDAGIDLWSRPPRSLKPLVLGQDRIPALRSLSWASF